MGHEAVDAVVATRIRDAIEQAGVSERKIYTAAGIPQATWDRIINRGGGSLRMYQLYRVARALGVEVDQLAPTLAEVAA